MKQERITLYVPDPNYLAAVREKVRDLWYETYGFYPKKGETLILALEHTAKHLQDNIEFVSDDVRDKYSRLSS